MTSNNISQNGLDLAANHPIQMKTQYGSNTDSLDFYPTFISALYGLSERCAR